jgi:hypothetical protein
MKKDALSLGRRNAPGASPGKGNQSTAFASNPAPGFGQSLLFVPGWTLFGGTYAAQIVQGEHYGPSTASINPPFAASADSRHRHQMLPAGGGVLRPRGAKLQ